MTENVLASDIYRQKATLTEDEMNQLARELEVQTADEVSNESRDVAKDAIRLVQKAISIGRKMNTSAFETLSIQTLHTAWMKRRMLDGEVKDPGMREQMVPWESLTQNNKDFYLILLRKAIKHTEDYIRKVPWHGDAFKSSLAQFLKPWEGREGYIGAMLVGSYGSGLQNKFSDIDVYVILDDKTDWRERGDKRHGDFLVEYNAHPISYIRELIRQDKLLGKRHCCRKVSTGIILSDPTGQVRALQDQAKHEMLEPLPQHRDSEWIEMSKYYMWDQIDNLRDMSERHDPGFPYAYFAGMVAVVDYYAKFLGAEVPRPVRAHQFFSSEDFCRSYSIAPFPDKDFSALVLECMKGAEIERINQLTEYVTKKMGGLEIDGWTLRNAVGRI